jgi:hypothetical protein
VVTEAVNSGVSLELLRPAVSLSTTGDEGGAVLDESDMRKRSQSFMVGCGTFLEIIACNGIGNE